MTNRPVDELPAEQAASTRSEGAGPDEHELPEAIKQIVTAAGPVPEFDRYVSRPVPSLLVVLTEARCSSRPETGGLTVT